MLRRNFLRGACGAAVGLPVLESLMPRRARAGGSDAPKRFIAFACCNGVEMDRFFPTSPYGALTAASLTGTGLEPLAGHVGKMLVPRGIHTVPRGFGFDPVAGCDHVKGAGHRLTAQQLDSGTLFAQGISLDQLIASKLNDGGRPALNLHVGYRYEGTNGVVSYLGANAPAVGENNPWLAYQDLMGLSGLGEEQLAQMVARRQSVLDVLEGEFGWLKSRDLGAADRTKLDMHLSTIRDLELDMFEGLVPCELDPARAAELAALDPSTIEFDSQFRTVGRMHMDLLALAIACGSTVAATLQWGVGAGGPIFTWDGMSHAYNHHKLSHGNTMDDNSGSEIAGFDQMIAQIDTWYAGELAYLADRLAAYEEGDATVLDNCALAWLHDLADGRYHSYQDMPHVLIGGCGGYLRTGQHVKVTAEASMQQNVDAGHSQLLCTILNAVGVTADGGGPITSFGDPEFALPGELDAIKA